MLKFLPVIILIAIVYGLIGSIVKHPDNPFSWMILALIIVVSYQQYKAYTKSRVPGFISWDELVTMDDRTFEYACAKWLIWHGHDAEVTQATADHNIDIVVKDRLGRPAAFGECKHWSKPVGAKELKVLVATMHERNIPEGWFFSLNGFSQDAKQYLSNSGVKVNLKTGKEMAG
jgi:hypothetical protein